jgi:hypothetical protein
MLGVGGVRWGEAAALRVSDIDFLRRRVTLHTNAVKVGGTFAVGSLKSGKNRTVVLPAFVIDALADACKGRSRDDLLWPSEAGGYLGPPSSHDSWLSGAVARCQKKHKSFPRVTRACATAHCGQPGHPRGRESEGGATDARARVSGDDTGRVRRSVRLRPVIGCRKCGQNVGTASELERLFESENASTSIYLCTNPVPPSRTRTDTGRILSPCPRASESVTDGPCIRLPPQTVPRCLRPTPAVSHEL